MTRRWTVATRTQTQTRRRRRTTITRICLCRATSSLGFLVVFSFFSLAFLLFAFISTHWLGQGGFFYGLFVPAGVFLSFRVGFLLFHGFSLVCFYPLRVFWFLCWAASALSLWVVVLLFHGLSCLLLCFIALLHFFASLLCFYLLIVFLILSAALYGFPISYLSLRF